MSDRFKIPLLCLVLAGVYFLTGTGGLFLATVTRSITLVWPPTGVSLAVLVLYGSRFWPGVLLGAFLTNILTPGVTAPTALGIAAGNTVEAVLGAHLLRRAGLQPQLGRVRDVLQLAVLGGIVSTCTSATAGTFALWRQGILDTASLPVAWRDWWIGDLLSDLMFAPLVLTWASPVRPPRAPRRVVEGAFLFLALVGVSLLTLGMVARGAGALHRPEPYAIFPVLIWAALRFDLRVVTGAAFLTSALSIYATTVNALASFHESLLLLQVFMGVVSVTSLLLAASSTERNRALHLRDNLLAMVSHDLKNPLGVISLSAATLMKGSRDGTDERAKMTGERIQRSAQRMDRIIDDLLDVASIEAGRLRLERGPCSVADLLAEAVESLEVLAREKGLRLVSEAPPFDLSIECDRARIVQVLGNLVGNSIKHTARDGSITLRVQPVENQVRFSVTDTGEGIPADQLGHVWERGWQSTTRPEKGSLGLGLFISKGIVEAHGGRIGLESKVGVGTTSWFTLAAQA
jgi:signal transduction histidine kinase